jgi:electron transfer flavoprotein beta subunit
MGKNIVVCVKQVPEVAEVQIDYETHTLIREGVPSVINPFDEFALEEAIKIRESHTGLVTVVTMGPSQSRDVLEVCIKMGADRGYLLCDDRLAGSDTWATSIALAGFIKKLQYDLIICGLETTDSSTAQVGPQLAEKLGIPQITFVNKIEFDTGGRTGTFTRETDTGYQIMEARLPLLVTVVKGINIPRDPDPKRAVGKKIKKVTVADLDIDMDEVGIDGSPTAVVEINPAKPRQRLQLVVDSSLPAHKRVEMIMMGGFQGKERSVILEEGEGDVAKKAGDFILEVFSN